MTELDSVYSHKEYEIKWWNFWASKAYFNAEAPSKKPTYTILMPPPNITSSLHMGHGLNNTVQDILARWKRMQGYNVCWLPGTDHAGIATQMMVERALTQEGTTRQKLGRPAFEKRLQEWKEKYGGAIVEQVKRLGCSCDWSRLAYTMDPNLSHAVRHTFVKLFEEGLIYRGERLVNWDCHLQTAVSDDEVENVEQSGNLWHIRYPVDGTDEVLTIATTRPETMFGDSAVAVNPDDERYKDKIGKFVRLPFVNRLIPIIGDSYVDKEFGTGVLKITPAHDPNDFVVGKRHNLPMLNIMNPDGTLVASLPERFRGLDRFVARKEVIRGLKELGLFDKDEPHKSSVPHSERSKTVIEPRLSLQWYVKMEPLAVPAIEAAKSGELKFYPETWKKTYLHWLENIQDWCISRQLWWGHRIPIWYCKGCSGVTTGMTDPTKCSKCGSADIKQDEDVLDTWFSSWLWPLSPFGWPDETVDLKTFFPSNVLATAPEIIFLWVARMIMAGYKFKGKLAFKDVYFNATVCDKQGRKFSKTLGNGIDPLEVIDKHGADAVRFSTINLAPLGGRVKMEVGDFETGARFINKIWNATRFILKYADAKRPIEKLNWNELDLPSKWQIHEFHLTAAKINKDLENYRLNEAVTTLYHFIWGTVCDWGIECTKEALMGKDASPERDRALSLLVYTLEGCFRMASPVMPFVTEELWHKLPKHPDWNRPESLVVAEFPTSANIPSFPVEHEKWKTVQSLIDGIRSVRSQAEIGPKEQVPVLIEAAEELVVVFEGATHWIRRLGPASDVKVATKVAREGRCLAVTGKGFTAYLPVGGLIDAEKEKKRVESEIKRISGIVKGIESKLANPNFASRAPEEVVAETRAQLENMKEQMRSLQANAVALA